MHIGEWGGEGIEGKWFLRARESYKLWCVKQRWLAACLSPGNSIAPVLYFMQFGFSKREMKPLHVSEDLWLPTFWKAWKVGWQKESLVSWLLLFFGYEMRRTKMWFRILKKCNTSSNPSSAPVTLSSKRIVRGQEKFSCSFPLCLSRTACLLSFCTGWLRSSLNFLRDQCTSQNPVLFAQTSLNLPPLCHQLLLDILSIAVLHCW